MPTPSSLFVLCLLSLAVSAAAPQAGDRRGSPFDGLRWNDGAPEVQVDDVWYAPLSIHGVAVDAILDFCGRRWPGKREKRFAEDLVEAMELMGHELPEAADLVLERLADGERVERTGVAVTRDKRNALRDAARDPQASRALQAALAARQAPAPVPLDAAALEADLVELAERLADQFAYLHLGDVDLAAELEAIRRAAPTDSAELASLVQGLMMRFRDGHARVQGPPATSARRYPPVLLAEAGGGVVAVRAGRRELLDPQWPYVISLDGAPVSEWIAALRPGVADGSPQLVRRRVLRGLRELEQHRELLGHDASGTVRYGLAATPEGPVSRTVELPLTPERPTYGDWPRRQTGLLADGAVGYLRLPAMDDDLIPGLHAAMQTFRDTRGLVVDVRGNGGGRRGLLLALAGYLVGPDEGPWVGNVCAYRLSERFDRDHLAARFAYRADDPRWSAAQRAAIVALAAEFEPEWPLPDGFSDWHYLVLDRSGHAGEFFYDRPVIVLADAGCFSATDIFLGALAGRPRVTLMGGASSGGSARSQSFRLPHSGIEVRCASMASFRPDGRLYDGRGIEVDIELVPRPEDLIEGGGDSVLEAAVQRLAGGG